LGYQVCLIYLLKYAALFASSLAALVVSGFIRAQFAAQNKTAITKRNFIPHII
jgi:hypothetical protein